MKCNFCGNAIPKGRGIMFVRNDGKQFYFCASKCSANFRLGRQGKKKKWSLLYEKGESPAKRSAKEMKKQN